MTSSNKPSAEQKVYNENINILPMSGQRVPARHKCVAAMFKTIQKSHAF